MISCVYDFVKAFSYSNDSHFSLLQQAKIKRNNIKVLSKLFAAVESQHTGIDINSLEYPLRRMFGDSWKRCDFRIRRRVDNYNRRWKQFSTL